MVRMVRPVCLICLKDVLSLSCSTSCSILKGKRVVRLARSHIGVYNKVKGSLVDEGREEGPTMPDFSGIEFYGENAIKIYDIDSTYIDRLLGT